MPIKPNSLDPRDPRREFVLERAGEREIDYDRELYDLLGKQLSFIISSIISEVKKALRMPKGATDEEISEKLVDILCDSNDGKLNIGGRTLKALESLDISGEKLETAKQLVKGRINLEVRGRITVALNKIDGINTGGEGESA